MAPRRTISPSIRQEVLIEAGYRCAVPTCRTILAIDLHHIVEVSEGGENDKANLIALCPTCHALFHRGNITREAIRVWKGVLISLNEGFSRETKDTLLFLASENRPVFYSAEGVLKFASLIASGLAKCGHEMMEVHSRGYGADRSKSTWAVELTDRGRLLIDAWREGDPNALENALQTGAGLNTDGQNS